MYSLTLAISNNLTVASLFDVESIEIMSFFFSCFDLPISNFDCRISPKPLGSLVDRACEQGNIYNAYRTVLDSNTWIGLVHTWYVRVRDKTELEIVLS